jgi:hypothetical protein
MTIYPHNRKLADWVSNVARPKAMYTVTTPKRTLLIIDRHIVGPYGLTPVAHSRYSREEILRVEETA